MVEVVENDGRTFEQCKIQFGFTALIQIKLILNSTNSSYDTGQLV